MIFGYILETRVRTLCVVSAAPADGSNMLKACAVSFETLWLSEIVLSLDPLHSVVRDEG